MPNNKAILTVAQIIKAVMSSAAEAELGALFINAREAAHIRQILEELGHKQPPTPIQTDNAAAEVVVNHKVMPKRTKAMDMRFHWLWCRQAQKMFRFFWKSGKFNIRDYRTKHHPGSHHQNMRPHFLTSQKYLKEFRERAGEGASSARVC